MNYTFPYLLFMNYIVILCWTDMIYFLILLWWRTVLMINVRCPSPLLKEPSSKSEPFDLLDSNLTNTEDESAYVVLKWFKIYSIRKAGESLTVSTTLLEENLRANDLFPTLVMVPTKRLDIFFLTDFTNSLSETREILNSC